jgi:hypothetical protein
MAFTMKPRMVAAVLALSLAPAAFAQTLCRKGETDHLSCPTNGGKKILSVCSNIKQGVDVVEDSWVQYRFGSPGKIELAFPKEKKGSLARFDGHYFSPHEQSTSVSDLRFTSGRVAYSVDLNRFYESDDGAEPAQYAAGVDVILGKNRRVAIQCDRVDGPRYFDTFRELNGLVRAGH